MSVKGSKTKEERLFEMYMKDLIDDMTFRQMWERIKKSNENKK